MSTPIRDSLDRAKVLATIRKLGQRIEDRFPGAGLLAVAGELENIAATVESDLRYIERPNWLLRGGVIFFITAVLLVLGIGLATTELGHEGLTLTELVGLVESIFNDVILIGAAVVFLFSLENRRKRRRVIESINRLRSLAHVIDMHQLTKDPTVLLVEGGAATAHSPTRSMSPYDLGRYLDYASELLSLVSKVGFCYVQEFDDPEAVAAVTELETLTNGLARKVWQKIMLLPRSA